MEQRAKQNLVGIQTGVVSQNSKNIQVAAAELKLYCDKQFLRRLKLIVDTFYLVIFSNKEGSHGSYDPVGFLKVFFVIH